MNDKLISLLRDPAGAQPLALDGDALVNRVSGRRYPIRDSIPVLLDEAELGPQNRKIQKMYAWMARGFDFVNGIGNFLYLGGVSKLRRQLAAGLGLKPGQRLLYTSIGTGLDLPFLAEQVRLDLLDFIGLDLSMEMLQKCRAKIGRYTQTALLLQANAERLPLADGVFDVALHVGGINQFDHPAAAVREMARVVRPGARIVIVDETPKVIKTQYQGRWNPFTRSTFKGMPVDIDPRAWVPSGVGDVAYQELAKGRIYSLSFTLPGKG